MAQRGRDDFQQVAAASLALEPEPTLLSVVTVEATDTVEATEVADTAAPTTVAPTAAASAVLELGRLSDTPMPFTARLPTSSRSDTFKLRCYGEAAQIDGKTGSAWLEVIVQRVPGFIDPTNAAETGNSAPRPLMIPTALPSTLADATVDTALTPVNHLLGRRFKVISMRWLRLDEI